MTIAIILAGGVGSRMSIDIPKQFVELSGQMMIMHSMLPFGESDMVDNIQIVAAEQWRSRIEDAVFEDPESEVAQKFLGFSNPGENRQLSILNAMQDIQKMLDPAAGNEAGTQGISSTSDTAKHTIRSVIIHDAARPFVTVECIEDCLKALETHDGAMPVLSMNDTVYFSRTGKRVDELLNRSCIYAGQAPEAFRFEKYFAATKALLPDQIMMIRGSTEPAIMAGLDVAMIPGDQRNFKITTDEDLERAEEILRSRQ
ncbi:MAG: 2-C-methyl-D-erythritol 4-phosphate cytidylyltransferase [Butyrivibrio sp.]|nr:2-C-methyl-D-erythritol 4-phosphate cytidylyltransferase [Butyrivibrio sp.]